MQHIVNPDIVARSYNAENYLHISGASFVKEPFDLHVTRKNGRADHHILYIVSGKCTVYEKDGVTVLFFYAALYNKADLFLDLGKRFARTVRRFLSALFHN